MPRMSLCVQKSKLTDLVSQSVSQPRIELSFEWKAMKYRFQFNQLFHWTPTPGPTLPGPHNLLSGGAKIATFADSKNTPIANV